MTAIVVALDFSDSSKGALAWAIKWYDAWRPKSHLIAAHVVEGLSHPMSELTPMLRGASLLDDATRELDQWLHQQGQLENTFDVIAGIGNPARELTRIARENDAHYLIVGATGRHGVEKWIVGSTAERLAHHPPCTLVIAGPSPFYSRTTPQLGVTIDFSELSRDVLDEAITLAQRMRGHLRLIHVAEYPTIYSTSLYASDFNTKILRDADAKLANLEKTYKNRLQTIEYSTSILTGMSAAQTIAEETRAHELDLLILGNKGRSALGDFFMGSVAHSIVKRMPCTLVLVPVIHAQ